MNRLITNALAEKIAQIACSAPSELVESILPRLLDWDRSSWSFSRAKTLASISNPQVRANFGVLFDLWQRDCSEVDGGGLALALQSSLALHERHEQMQLDFTWTGPETGCIPMRRTDGALLQLIDSAQESLLIVSFAVYRVQAVAEALQAALDRGVRVKIILEQPEERGGKLTFSGAPAFGQAGLQRASLYTWPFDKRPRTVDDKYGSLHAKVALADDNFLFISSANLTEYALSLNMEMGVLIQGGDLPGQAGQHFEELINQGVLLPFFVQTLPSTVPPHTP